MHLQHTSTPTWAMALTGSRLGMLILITALAAASPSPILYAPVPVSVRLWPANWLNTPSIIFFFAVLSSWRWTWHVLLEFSFGVFKLHEGRDFWGVYFANSYILEHRAVPGSNQELTVCLFKVNLKMSIEAIIRWAKVHLFGGPYTRNLCPNFSEAIRTLAPGHPLPHTREESHTVLSVTCSDASLLWVREFPDESHFMGFTKKLLIMWWEKGREESWDPHTLVLFSLFTQEVAGGGVLFSSVLFCTHTFPLTGNICFGQENRDETITY